MFSSLFDCLFISNFAQKLPNRYASGKVGNGRMNNSLNFGGDPDHHLDTGIVFQIRQYWEIRQDAAVLGMQ